MPLRRAGGVFNDCHGGTVYCLASYDAGSKKLVTLSHPFSVDVDSAKMEFYAPEKETEDVVLFSKFGMIGEFFLGRMVGGVFEGSRSPGFEHPRHVVPDSGYALRFVYGGACRFHESLPLCAIFRTPWGLRQCVGSRFLFVLG